MTCWPPVDIYGAVLAEAVRQGVERDFDLVLCDTSGRKYLHTSELFCTRIWLRAVMHNNMIVSLKSLGRWICDRAPHKLQSDGGVTLLQTCCH